MKTDETNGKRNEIVINRRAIKEVLSDRIKTVLTFYFLGKNHLYSHRNLQLLNEKRARIQ